MAKNSKIDNSRHPNLYQRQNSGSVQSAEDELVVSDGSQFEFELSLDNENSVSKSKSAVLRRGSVSSAIATSSAAESTSDGRRNRGNERQHAPRRYRKQRSSSSSSSSCSSTSSSSSSESDDENKPYFVDKRREIERLQRKPLKCVRKSSSDRGERVAKKELSRRQIKRKERFAKYRLEKKIQRQLNSDNQQQQPKPQQQLMQKPPPHGQQQQCNIPQHRAPSIEAQTPEQTRSEWNDRPRVVFVQVPQMAYTHMDYGMAHMHNMHYLPHPPNGFCHPIPPHPAHYRRPRPMYNGCYGPSMMPMHPMQRCPPQFRSFQRYPHTHLSFPRPFRRFSNQNGN